ncbi:hypothetical protein HanXRQr2_Chr12g0535481 [Helianthus annuus]|uniref:Rapid ALkalinization Factor n=1 Tax=Helianthus annuus TaxID=4232 RepID=A0A251T475_HELAN|nr:hypothetical protein HanXRQr2_Chr12g0535481 [Helianthus annuus]KAJ0492619.1 hypothetical protein HanIR_Chr12g0576901 [Helianthus annuus]KAJ0862238.1 hypothetical protein HanPSC8_Chr12g0515781 [Helianthus annuus]
MVNKRCLVGLILISFMLIISSSDASPPAPPKFQGAHGKESPRPPKNRASPPPPSHGQQKPGHISVRYESLQRGSPVCNASIHGNCGRRCTKSYSCRH